MKLREIIIRLEAKFYAVLLALFPIYDMFSGAYFPALREYLPDDIYKLMGITVVAIGFLKAIYLSRHKPEGDKNADKPVDKV